jgi:hypothetical protein
MSANFESIQDPELRALVEGLVNQAAECGVILFVGIRGVENSFGYGFAEDGDVEKLTAYFREVTDASAVTRG